MPHITAIIPAAGQGSRMQSNVNKQYLSLNGKPILAHTLAVFENSELINGVILVVRKEEIDFCREEVVDRYSFGKVQALVPGGKERVDSVARGLEKCSPDTDVVVVHDGARPLLTCCLLHQVLEKALQAGAAIAAVPVKDCIKEVEREKVVVTLERQRLWAVQTPQAFKYQLLKEAFNTPFPPLVYDEAMLVELSGHKVTVVRGDYSNLKVTTPEDLKIASVLMGVETCE